MKKENIQSLFEKEDVPFAWEKEWNGMPEYKMDDKTPVQQIIISFKSYEDAKKFGELLGQKVSKKTKSLWYPKEENYIEPKNFIYTDEP